MADSCASATATYYIVTLSLWLSQLFSVPYLSSKLTVVGKVKQDMAVGK